MQFFNQILKINYVPYYEKKKKHKYNPKIETVKYLEVIDKNKSQLIFITAPKCANFQALHLVIQVLILFDRVSYL